jgi:Recombinase
MESEHAERSLRRRGVQGALANKQAARSRARVLVPTVRKLKAKGYVTRQALGEKLNRRGIPAPQGGRWHSTTVIRMLARLGLIALGNGRSNSRLAAKRAADARAKALAATVRELRKAGFVSLGAIARELNKRRVRAARGGKWHRSSISQLLRRLETLDP